VINYNDSEVALNFLVNTDIEAARAKCLYDGLLLQKKTVRAIQFLNSSGSAAERTEKALASEAYKLHLKKIEDAQIEFETFRNQRGSNALIIEMWRSVNSNQKKGNI